MLIMQVLHMNGGNGDTSYARNSTVQSKIISLAKPIVEETVTKFISDKYSPENIGIADLGCGSGANTLTLVSEIITVLQNKCGETGKPLSELRVYLNDLENNDFNGIFALLPGFHRRLNIKPESCFIAGVPGSFYGRLFPSKSIHILHSSSSLHWLSKVPNGLESGVLNKGKIFISKSSSQDVVDAYTTQFHKDFSLFLESRSKELVPGGRMVLSFMGRSSVDPTSEEEFYQWELLAIALMTMAHEGLVEEHKVDSFNVPYYAPCAEEIKAETEEEGSFVIDRLEAFPIDWDGGYGWCNGEFSAAAAGRRVADTVRAVVESMLEAQFGKEIMDELFRRYEKLVENHMSKTRAKYINLVISMVRK